LPSQKILCFIKRRNTIPLRLTLSTKEDTAINKLNIVPNLDIAEHYTENNVEQLKPSTHNLTTHSASDINHDHFIEHHGIKYAGRHLIIDLWEAENLDNLEIVEEAMRKVVEVCGATLLHIHLHHFTPNGGISGVAVLAESHISIHSWPERKYAALDVFMCGTSEPNKSLAVLQEAFNPKNIYVNEQMRGALYERELV
jgi:S-adenosylmethionine decarboxylase